MEARFSKTDQIVITFATSLTFDPSNPSGRSGRGERDDHVPTHPVEAVGNGAVACGEEQMGRLAVLDQEVWPLQVAGPGDGAVIPAHRARVGLRLRMEGPVHAVAAGGVDAGAPFPGQAAAVVLEVVLHHHVEEAAVVPDERVFDMQIGIGEVEARILGYPAKGTGRSRRLGDPKFEGRVGVLARLVDQVGGAVGQDGGRRVGGDGAVPVTGPARLQGRDVGPLPGTEDRPGGRDADPLVVPDLKEALGRDGVPRSGNRTAVGGAEVVEVIGPVPELDRRVVLVQGVEVVAFAALEHDFGEGVRADRVVADRTHDFAVKQPLRVESQLAPPARSEHVVTAVLALHHRAAPDEVVVHPEAAVAGGGQDPAEDGIAHIHVFLEVLSGSLVTHSAPVVRSVSTRKAA